MITPDSSGHAGQLVKGQARIYDHQTAAHGDTLAAPGQIPAPCVKFATVHIRPPGTAHLCRPGLHCGSGPRRLYTEHSQALLRLAWLLTQDAALAEEIVYDAFEALQ
jgi:hypothetical protein